MATVAVEGGVLGRPLRSCSGKRVAGGQQCERIQETPGKVLEAVMAGKSSRTTMLTPGGRGPPRLHGKELSKEVAMVLLSGFETYNSHIRWGGLVDSATLVEAKIGQLGDAGQGYTLSTLHFRRGRSLREKYPKKGLEQIDG